MYTTYKLLSFIQVMEYSVHQGHWLMAEESELIEVYSYPPLIQEHAKLAGVASLGVKVLIFGQDPPVETPNWSLAGENMVYQNQLIKW